MMLVLLIKKSRSRMLCKGGKMPIGSVRKWGGTAYIKIAPGDWRKFVAGKESWDSGNEKAKELKISDFGTLEEVREMAQMPGTAHSFADARRILEGIVDKPMTSKSGLSATLSKKSIKKILSGEAAGKSVDLKAHLKAAANLEKLYSNAIEKWEFEINPGKNNEGLKDRKYLYSPMEHKGHILPVKMTVKEYKDAAKGQRLYSIEAVDVDLWAKKQTEGAER